MRTLLAAIVLTVSSTNAMAEQSMQGMYQAFTSASNGCIVSLRIMKSGVNVDSSDCNRAQAIVEDFYKIKRSGLSTDRQRYYYDATKQNIDAAQVELKYL